MDINLKDHFVLIDSVTMKRDSHSAFKLKYVKIIKDTYKYDIETIIKEFDSFVKSIMN